LPTLSVTLVCYWSKDWLTAAGAFLVNHFLRTEVILAQAALGFPEFRTPGRALADHPAVGVSGTYLLPEIIAQFREAHPGMHVTLALGTSARALEALRLNRAELGVVGGSRAGVLTDVQIRGWK